MGGIMKGGAYGNMHAAYSSSSRRRWMNVYMVMVILCLVFGCGILGLIGLHRLKERRILNLSIKERDDQILSIHHLLQKEREQMQEIKRKTEEMTIKIFSLQAQKTELNGRVLDMQSTISSLREEQRTIELALEEKQNEAKLLREKYMEAKDQIPQVKALMEVLRQKDAEIEDLKRRLQLDGAKVGSERTDEHSMAEPNKSGTETTTHENKEREMQYEERKNPADDMVSTTSDASRYRVTEISVQSEEDRENGTLITGRSETASKDEFGRLENAQERSVDNGRTNVDRGDEVEPKDNYDHRKGRSSGTRQEKNEDETETIGNLGNEEQKSTDEDSQRRFTNNKELATIGDTHSRIIPKSQGSDDQELRVHRGLVKLGMQENSNSRHYRLRGKHRYLKRAKGKRWRLTAKQTEEKRTSQINGASTMRGQGLVERMEVAGDKHEEDIPRNQDEVRNPIMGTRVQNESVSEHQQLEIEDKLPNAGHGEDTEDMSHKVAKLDMSNQYENGSEVPLTNSSLEKSHFTLDEVAMQSAAKIEDPGSSNKGAVNHTEEDEQSKEREITITGHVETKNDGQNNHRLEKKEVAETNEDPEGVQRGNFEENESGEDGEDTEQTDEHEF